MKKIIFVLIVLGGLEVSANDKRLVSELTITELKETVRQIVEDSIEKCVVSGTMKGRAKVNLRVEGEVVAKMDCVFEEPEMEVNDL
jgi:hypothetical protein